MPRLPIRYLHADPLVVPISTTPTTNPLNRLLPRARGDPFARNPIIVDFLRTPTWSVRDLLKRPKAETKAEAEAGAGADTAAGDEPITLATLRKLLRLSALPLPSEPAAQEALLDAVRAQVGFVNAIRSVDTTGVRPLVRIADESEVGKAEDVLNMEKLGLSREGKGKGKKSWTGRVRRRVEDEEDGVEEMVVKEDGVQEADDISADGTLDAGSEGQVRDARSYLDDADPEAIQTSVDPPTATLDDIEILEAPSEEREPWNVATMAGSRMKGRYFVVRRPSQEAKPPKSSAT